MTMLNVQVNLLFQLIERIELQIFIFAEFSKCYLKLQSTSSNFWILGASFIQAYYTEFDVEVF
jgi:hypothetical protein